MKRCCIIQKIAVFSTLAIALVTMAAQSSAVFAEDAPEASATISAIAQSEQPLSQTATILEDNLWIPSDMTDGTQQAYIVSKGVCTIPQEDGTNEEVATTLYQWADAGESVAVTASCSHSNKQKVGTLDLTRVHGPEHPGYCHVYLRQTYRCNNCGTKWTETTISRVWCTSSHVIDSVTEPTATE